MQHPTAPGATESAPSRLEPCDSRTMSKDMPFSRLSIVLASTTSHTSPSAHQHSMRDLHDCVDRGDTTCCWRGALRSKWRPLPVGSLTSHALLPGHRPHHISLCATCQAIRARFESMNTDEAAVKAAQIARVQRCVYLRRHPHCMRQFAARLFPSALERTIWSYIGGPLGTPPNCSTPRAASSLATASTLISTGVLALICMMTTLHIVNVMGAWFTLARANTLAHTTSQRIAKQYSCPRCSRKAKENTRKSLTS
jgi:hypothetical protein